MGGSLINVFFYFFTGRYVGQKVTLRVHAPVQPLPASRASAPTCPAAYVVCIAASPFLVCRTSNWGRLRPFVRWEVPLERRLADCWWG